MPPFFIRYRLAIVVSSVAILCLALVGLSKSEISADNRLFYSPSFQPYIDLLQFEQTFSTNSKVVFVLESSEPVVISSNFKESVRWLTKEAYRLRNASRVDSLATLPHLVVEADDVRSLPLLDFVCPLDNCVEERVAEFRKISLRNRYVDESLKVVSVVVALDIDEGLSAEVTQTDREIRSLVQEFKSRFPDIKIVFTGAVPMMQAFMDAALNDVSGVLGICFVLVFVLLCATLGGIKAGSMVFVTGLYSGVVTVGLASYSGIQLNTATAITPLVIFVLVVASALHLARFMHERSRIV